MKYFNFTKKKKNVIAIQNIKVKSIFMIFKFQWNSQIKPTTTKWTRPKKNDNNNHQIKRHFYFLLFFFFLFYSVFANIFPLTNWKWVTFAVFVSIHLLRCKMLYLFVITPFAIVYVGVFFFFRYLLCNGTSETNQPRNKQRKSNEQNNGLSFQLNGRTFKMLHVQYSYFCFCFYDKIP